MVQVNKHYDNLPPSYLFSTIGRKTREFSAANPQARIIRLGIGDTTRPLPPVIVDSMVDAARRLGTPEGYKEFGHYGDEQGMTALRQAIVNRYGARGIQLDPSEVLVSDGAKSDLGNLQGIFAPRGQVAIQDPVYPAYLDVTVINGRSGKRRENGTYPRVVYMPGTPENGFIPSVPKRKVDLIYLCSPNNPTGAVMDHDDLEEFVQFAIRRGSVIIFDAAYSAFIEDPSLPRSIYEIKDAKRCAIEVQSFSKSDGFTGLRLGYTIVPRELEAERTTPGRLNQLWNRRQTTFFNGASCMAQMAGLAALTPEGIAADQEIVNYYKSNAKAIRAGLESMGLDVFGGTNAPYVWVRTPNGMKSWDFFDKLLAEANVVGTPGSGFGLAGEGFFRLSGFGSKEDTQEAIERIQKRLRL